MNSTTPSCPGRKQIHHQRDAGHLIAVHGDIDGVNTGFVEFQLLDADDEIERGEMNITGQAHLKGKIDAGHDELPIGIDEADANVVGAVLAIGESDAQGDGALKLRGGELLREDGVEGAEEIELAVVIGGGITQDGDLDIHGNHEAMNGEEWHENFAGILLNGNFEQVAAQLPLIIPSTGTDCAFSVSIRDVVDAPHNAFENRPRHGHAGQRRHCTQGERLQ